MSFRYLCYLCDGFFVLICKQIVNFSKNTPKKGFLNAYPLRGYFFSCTFTIEWPSENDTTPRPLFMGSSKSFCFLGRGGATKWKRFSCLHGNDWYGVCDDEASVKTFRWDSGAGTISGETAIRFWGWCKQASFKNAICLYLNWKYWQFNIITI